MLFYCIGFGLMAAGALAWSLFDHTVGAPTVAAGAILILLHATNAIAADLPVIGASALPKNKAHEQAAYKRLLRKCNDENPPKNETEAQFMKRLSLPCPGRLE